MSLKVYVDNGFHIEIDDSMKGTFESLRPWYVNYNGPGKGPIVKRSEMRAGRNIGFRLANLILGVPQGQGVTTGFIDGNSHNYCKANLKVV